MASPEDFLRARETQEPATESTDYSPDDFVTARADNSYRPPFRPTRPRPRLGGTSRLMTAFTAEGVAPSKEQLGKQVTLRVGDEQVEAEDTFFADLPGFFRTGILGAASLGAVIEDPILRMRGRGDLADQNRRNVERLNAYSRELAKESFLGPTVGVMLHDVATSLQFGTLAAPFGGTKPIGNLAATSTAFGLDGADRLWVETEGLPEAERSRAWGRQFLIDGGLTFAAGKLLQSLGFNPGRYFGAVTGREALKAAERTGLSHVLGSAIADAGVNGTQGGLTYLNEAYTGTREFDFQEFVKSAAMSGAVGGVAGAATAGAHRLTAAWDKFRAQLPKAIDGAKSANTFAETATPEQIGKALDAKSAKELAAITGEKSQGRVWKEGFQDELASLAGLQLEIESRTGKELGNLAQREGRLNEQRAELAKAEEKMEGLKTKLKEQTTLEDRAATRAEIMQLAESTKPLKESVAAETEALAKSRQGAANEELTHRAYLESELNRLESEEAKAIEAANAAPLAEPVFRQTPKKFEERYTEIEDATQTVADAINRTHDGQTLSKDEQLSFGKLIDTHVKGQDHKVRLNQALAQARTPGQTRQALHRLEKHLDSSRKRVARSEFNSAVKKAKNLRTKYADRVAEIKTNVNRDSVDSLQDSAEMVREATYQSEVDDTFLTQNRAKGIQETADQVAAEISEETPAGALEQFLEGETFSFEKIPPSTKVRSLAMKADDLVRQALKGEPHPALSTKRQAISLDSPFFRELAMRPEVQMARLSDTLRREVYERLAIHAQADYDLYTKEVVQGFGDYLDALGLEHGTGVDATIEQFASRGKGTALETWRTETRDIEGVELTRDEALLLHYLDKDPRNKAALSRLGFKFPDMRVYPELNDRIRNQIADFVGEQGEAIADWMFRYGNGPLIERVNNSKQLLSGRILTDHKDVVPRVLDPTWDLVGSDPLKALFNATVQSYSHLRHRTLADRALTTPEGTTGAFDYFLNHADRMNRVAAFLPATRDAQAVINNPKVEKLILEKDGTFGLDNLREAIRLHVIGPKMPSSIGRNIARWNAVNAAAILGARISTALIQGTSTIASAAWEPNGVRDYVAALPKLASPATLERMEAILGEFSGHYWRRYTLASAAGEQTGGVYNSRGWFRPPTIAQQALRPLQEVERVVNSVLRFDVAERRARRAGLTPDMPEYGPFVARDWERQTYRGENSSQGLELSGFLREGRDSPAFGTLVTFQNTASKIYSLLPFAADQMQQGKYRDAVGTLAAFVAATLPVSLIREALTHSDSDEPFLKAAGKRWISDLASLHPLGSLSLQPLVRQLMGMQQYETGPALAQNAGRAAWEVGKLAYDIATAEEVEKDPKVYAERIMRVVRPVGTLAGLPVLGIEDIVKRIQKGTLFPGLDRGDSDTLTWEEKVKLLEAGE